MSIATLPKEDSFHPKRNFPRSIHSAQRVSKESKVSDFRIHDLRRTAASFMAKSVVNRTVLGKILNQKGLAGDDKVTAIYDRHEYMKEKRVALQNWAHLLRGIISESKVTAKVIECQLGRESFASFDFK